MIASRGRSFLRGFLPGVKCGQVTPRLLRLTFPHVAHLTFLETFSLLGWGRPTHLRHIFLHASVDFTDASNCILPNAGGVRHRHALGLTARRATEQRRQGVRSPTRKSAFPESGVLKRPIDRATLSG